MIDYVSKLSKITSLLVQLSASFSFLCRITLLPPANEVWGKVMFLHMSVSHSVYRGRVATFQPR